MPEWLTVMLLRQNTLTLAEAVAQTIQMPTSAFAALLAAIVSLVLVIPKAVDYVMKKPADQTDKTDPMLPILGELTRALKESSTADGRLANVLERLEGAIERELGKVETKLADHDRQLQGLDYRTREIRDDVKALPDRVKEIVVAAQRDNRAQ